MKYRKKPVVVDAWRYEAKTFIQAKMFIEKIGADKVARVGAMNGKAGIIIHTLEGDHLAEWGDYIIKGVAGEFYPCKADIFEATYETA